MGEQTFSHTRVISLDMLRTSRLAGARADRIHALPWGGINAGQLFAPCGLGRAKTARPPLVCPSSTV
jgi:hypothetical protein